MPECGIKAATPTIAVSNKTSIMRQTFRLFIFLILFICSIDLWSQTNVSQKFLVVGSDSPKSNSCKDSCVIDYDNYTVITKAHKDSPGEEIIVINDSSKSRINIDVKNYYNAQYFIGLVGDKVLIDVGTSIMRLNYIYDLKKQCKLDSMLFYPNPVKIINNKLYYTTVMTQEKVKQLNLPSCDYTNLEFNGYVEDMYYDLKTRKITSLEKYECIK